MTTIMTNNVHRSGMTGPLLTIKLRIDVAARGERATQSRCAGPDLPVGGRGLFEISAMECKLVQPTKRFGDPGHGPLAGGVSFP